MGETRNSTVPSLSLAADSHQTSNSNNYSFVEKECIPDLCHVNCNHKNCFMVELKSKEMEESTERTTSNGENRDNNVTLLESWMMLHMPLLLQPLWGGVEIIRSIFITYVLESLLMVKADNKFYRSIVMSESWPPALVFLAVVTLTALIIHPDGFTWIVLRKIR